MGSPVLVDGNVASGATRYVPEKKIFYAGGYYYFFYSDGTNICYRSSSDKVHWSSKNNTGWPAAQGNTFEVRFFPNYSSSYCYIAWIDTSGPAIYFCRGSIGSGTISWGTAYQVYSSGSAYPTVGFAVCVGCGTDGTVYVGFTIQNIVAHNFFTVYYDLNNDGSGSWTQCWTAYHGIGVSYYMYGTIQQLSGGYMLAVYSSVYTSCIYSKRGKGILWGAEVTAVSGTLNSLNFAAESWSTYCLIMWYNDAPYPLQAMLYTDGTGWGSVEYPFTTGNDGTWYPGDICCDGLGNSWLLYYSGSYIYVIERSSSASYGTQTQLETTTQDFTAPVCTESLVSGYIGFGWVLALPSPPPLYFDSYNTAPPPPPTVTTHGDGLTWVVA